MSLDALIFDVDGTLADTEETHRQAFNYAFLRFDLGWEWPKPLYRELLKISLTILASGTPRNEMSWRARSSSSSGQVES